MRFTDSPNATAEIRVAAAPATVWDLVADIALPARFSDEFQGADWVDPTSPTGVGARFLGRNKNPSIGEWEVTCTVIRWDPPAAFAWAVGDLDAPAATWGFDLEPDGDGTRLRQWAQMGPGPSGGHDAYRSRPRCRRDDRRRPPPAVAAEHGRYRRRDPGAG